MDKPIRKLSCSKTDYQISGVCGGLGEYFQIDPVFFRIGFAGAFFYYGVGLMPYIGLALILPRR